MSAGRTFEFEPTFRLLAWTFFRPVCALESGPVLLNGLRLIFGQFCQPSVYEGKALRRRAGGSDHDQGGGEGHDRDEREKLRAHDWMMPVQLCVGKRGREPF